jgi:glycosyltransferase involved in cell wall biosynthesis
LVIDNENAFVVMPNDVKGLNKAMMRLFDDELRDKMGKRSKELVKKVCKTELETNGFQYALSKAIQLHLKKISGH